MKPENKQFLQWLFVIVLVCVLLTVLFGYWR